MPGALLMLLLLGLAGLLGAASGLCREPGGGDVPVGLARLSIVQESYEDDFPLVYKCPPELGYGYLHIRCRGAAWGLPDRKCSDEPPFSEGSGVGIGLFLLTLAVSVVMVAMATRLQRQSLDVERQQATEMQHNQPPQHELQAQQNGGFRYQPEHSNAIET